MMTPKSDCGIGATDRWLMEILMELGSANTLLASLCRSIERMNPGIAFALVHCDRQSGELEALAAPGLSEEFAASLSRVSPPEMRRISGQWNDGAEGTRYWWLEIQGATIESEVGLLAVNQCTDKSPPVMDVASIEAAMRLANRIFEQQRVKLPMSLATEFSAEVAYIN